jgi:uncharacterized protein (DUF2267 family)
VTDVAPALLDSLVDAPYRSGPIARAGLAEVGRWQASRKIRIAGLPMATRFRFYGYATAQQRLEGESTMSTMTLDVFDTTIHKTNEWLKHLMEAADWHDRRRAYLALRATLHALRDRLTVDETAQLAAQLPMLVRGFFYEGWNPSRKPAKERHREQFLARVAQELGSDDRADPEPAVRAAFAVMARHVTEGEISDVKQVLPAEVRELWP